MSYKVRILFYQMYISVELLSFYSQRSDAIRKPVSRDKSVASNIYRFLSVFVILRSEARVYVRFSVYYRAHCCVIVPQRRKMNNTSCLYSDDEPPDVQQLRHVVYGVTMPVILSFGLLVNIFSLLAAARSALNSVTLSYLLSLISSNLSLMILAIPWLGYRNSEYSKCHVHSDAFYHAYVEPLLINWMLTFSTYVLLCMSIERYISVSYPGFFRSIHRMSKARAVLIGSLLLSFLIFVPLFLKHIVVCSECWRVELNTDLNNKTAWQAYIWICQLLARFLPSLALIVLNITTIIKYRGIIGKRNRMTTDAVSASQHNTPNTSLTNLSAVNNKKRSAAQLNQSYRDEKRQLWLLSGLVCLVAVCIIPVGVSALLVRTQPYQYYTFQVVVEALELFHHAVVSFVICLCNNDIHRRLEKAITCISASV